MHSPLQRLYQTKLVLLATGFVVVGLFLLQLVHWSEHTNRLAWIEDLPIGEAAAGLFAAGLVLVGVEFVDRSVGEQREDERTSRLLAEQAPAFRDAVIQGFAFNADDLARVASPAVLDQIAENVLTLRLGDRGLAHDAYTDLRQQVIQAPERWRDVSVSVSLVPWEGGPAAGMDAMFVATLRWEYRTVPATPTMRFSCVAEIDEYRELVRDPAVTSVWYLGQRAAVDAGSREAYELVQFSVDGRPRPIRHTQRAGAQTYRASMPSSVQPQQEVTISYTYRVLVKQLGHLLYLDIPRPSKGLHVEFAYGGCGIRTLDARDFIASSQRARISQTPACVPTPTVDIGFDGWLFPKSGVAFVWSLENEVSAR